MASTGASCPPHFLKGDIMRKFKQEYNLVPWYSRKWPNKNNQWKEKGKGIKRS